MVDRQKQQQQNRDVKSVFLLWVREREWMGENDSHSRKTYLTIFLSYGWALNGHTLDSINWTFIGLTGHINNSNSLNYYMNPKLNHSNIYSYTQQ